MLLYRLLFFVILLSQVYASIAQDDCEIRGDFYIYKQSEIDRFAINYPGCTSISGDLIIEESYQGTILNLQGLSQLEKVGGAIEISSNFALSSLDGLENIDTIGENLYIQGNQVLSDIDAITGLKALKYGLHIHSQNSIQHIDTFLYLDTLWGVTIRNVPNLKDLSCFSNVQHINYYFVISENEVMERLEGLHQLESIGESLELSGITKITNLEGLENLRHAGWLMITKQPILQNLAGLNSLEWIRGLHLEDNAQLISFEQLEHLNPDSLKYITIRDNPLLSQCHISPVCQAFHHSDEVPEIDQNGTGCSTPLELIGGCEPIGTCPQDLILKTQSDVDHFAVVYPGCDSIYGNLSIQSTSISNLHGLAQIRYIGGDLLIYGNDDLTTLDGLGQVAWIGGAIDISYNDRLQSISGLSGLQEINSRFSLLGNDSLSELPDLDMFSVIQGDFFLINNDALSSIQALSDLRYINGSLIIEANPSLSSLAGLENLEYLAGSLLIENIKVNDFSVFTNLDTIKNQLYISDCRKLNNLNGLDHLRSLKSLHISKCDSLQDINGLNNLTMIAGKIEINNNDALESISGLGALQQAGGMVTIKNNPLLQHINAFRLLTTTGGIELENNPQLTSLEGFEELQTINGNVILKSMPGLTSLDGFNQLNAIQGDLDVSGNDNLLTLDGLGQLAEIGDKLMLKDNILLGSLSGMSVLQHIGGTFVIDNCGLSNLDGFMGLDSIGGALQIVRNPNLMGIEGFEQMTMIGGLYVTSNPQLISFSGLSELSSITGTVEIRSNAKLNHLPAWEMLLAMDTTLEISSNNKLKNIDFLNHLERVGSLEIENNPIDTLDCKRLKQINGDLKIQRCGLLEGIFMDSLVQIEGDLNISDNGQLDSLGSFKSLIELGGDIRISNNLRLLDLEAISTLKRFKGRLNITGNQKLQTLEGLRNVERSSFYVPDNLVNQDLFNISDNDNLRACAIPAICEIFADPSAAYYLNSNFSGCNNTIEVQAHCGLPNSCLADNIIFDSQASIDAFPANYQGCTFVTGSLIIDENLAGDILNLDSLSYIHRIGGDLVIRNNSALTELEGLSMLTELGGALMVQNNSSLRSLLALQNLAPHADRVQGTSSKEFSIEQNPKLLECSIPFVCSTMTDPYKDYLLSENMTGCNAVTEVQSLCDYPTECELGYVSSQEALNEFRIRHPKCTHITDYINITIDYQISDLSPLSLIESVDGAVYLRDIEILKTLDGLDNLITINGPLVIENNNFLEDISALRQLDPSTLRKNSHHFKLNGNTMLSACAIQSVCQIVENQDLTTKISDNGYRCDTREQILKNCLVGVLAPNENLEILIYPNPATNHLQIASTYDLHHEIISVAIVDINGSIRSVSAFTSSLDVSHLPPGLYMILLQSREHGLMTHRFIIAR